MPSSLVQQWIDRLLVGSLLVVLVFSASQSFGQTASSEAYQSLPESSLDESAKSLQLSNSTRFRVAEPRRQTLENFKKNLFFRSNIDLGARSAEDERFQQTAASLKIDNQLQYRITESLEFDSELRVIFNSERSQVAVRDDQLESGFRLRKAELAYEPFSFIRASAGALMQGELVRSDLLIQNGEVFPGFRQKMLWGEQDKNYVLVQAQQSIPTSRSLDSDRIEKEPMPYFFMESVSLGWKATSWLTMQPYYSVWRYQNLPARVAADGFIRGNSVLNAAVPTSASFRFGFEGFLTGIKAKLKVSDSLSFEPFFDELRNTAAPNGLNTGRMLGLETEFRLGEVSYVPTYAMFFNESDASVAAYNSGELGRNNREGYLAKLKIHFHRYKFSFVGEFFDARLINPDRLDQTDFIYWTVGLRTYHVYF